LLAKLSGPKVVGPAVIEGHDRARRVRFRRRLERLANDRLVE
jgi:hypothetical protein